MEVIGNPKACCKTNKDCCCCCPCRNTDLVFLCDTTGSMGGSIQSAQDAFETILDKLVPDDDQVPVQEKCRIAVAEFKDNGDGGDFVLPGKGYRLLNALTSDKGVIQGSINSLTPAGGGDGPEEWAASLVGLANNWTGELNGSTQIPDPAPPGRYRVIVLVTDVNAHYYPDPCDGSFVYRTDCYPTPAEVTTALSDGCIYLYQLNTNFASKADIEKAICEALKKKKACNAQAEFTVRNSKLFYNKFAAEKNVIQRKVTQRACSLDAENTIRRKQLNDYLPEHLIKLAEKVQKNEISPEEYQNAMDYDAGTAIAAMNRNNRPLRSTPRATKAPKIKEKPCCQKKMFD